MHRLECHGPVDRASHVVRCGTRDVAIAVRDTADVAVLAEHEARNRRVHVSAHARRRLSIRCGLGAPRTTSTPANPTRLARWKSCSSSGLGSTSVQHAARSLTAVPERRSGLQTGKRRESARARAGCGGRSCTARDPRRSRTSALPSAPARPSGYHAPSSWKREIVAFTVELEEFGAAQNASANRSLGAMDPERANRRVRCARRRPCGSARWRRSLVADLDVTRPTGSVPSRAGRGAR